MHPSEDKINDFSSYLPIKDAVKKINAWMEGGAEISYLTSRTKFSEILQIKNILKKYNFPNDDQVYSRHEGEDYKKVVETLKPDILIEDDCASFREEDDAVIGPKLNPELNIHDIVVPEFGGIDHLPDRMDDLAEMGKKEEIIEEAD